MTYESIDNDWIGLRNAYLVDNMEYPPCPECGGEHNIRHCEGVE